MPANRKISTCAGKSRRTLRTLIVSRPSSNSWNRKKGRLLKSIIIRPQLAAWFPATKCIFNCHTAELATSLSTNLSTTCDPTCVAPWILATSKTKLAWLDRATALNFVTPWRLLPIMAVLSESAPKSFRSCRSVAMKVKRYRRRSTQNRNSTTPWRCTARAIRP